MISWLKLIAATHPVRDEDLSAFVDARLPDEQADKVQDHVTTCESCRDKLAGLQAVKAALAALPESRPRRSFALTPEHAKKPALAAGQGPRPRFGFAPALALSALLILLAVDFAVIGGNRRADDSVGGATAGLQKAAEGESAAGAVASPDVAFRGATGTPAPPLAAVPSGAADQPAVTAATGAASPAVARGQAREAADDAGAGANTESPPAAAGNNEEVDRTVVRVLEGLAAVALLGSLAFSYFRWRTARSNQEES